MKWDEIVTNATSPGLQGGLAYFIRHRCKKQKKHGSVRVSG